MSEHCPQCGFDREGWQDITKECEVELKVTSTKDAFGYIYLKHEGNVIGSFDGSKFSYHSSMDKLYKVAIVNRAGYHEYFKVFTVKIEDE